MKTAGNYIALQMLPFRWSPATGSADKHVVQIEGRAIFQGALASVGIVFFLKSLKKKKVKVAQSCPTLCDFMDHSPWNSPGQNTRVSSLFLLQGIVPTQGSNLGLLHCGRILYQLSHSSVQFSSVAQSCPTLCDPMNRSTPGLPVHHQLLEFTQTHVH